MEKRNIQKNRRKATPEIGSLKKNIQGITKLS